MLSYEGIETITKFDLVYHFLISSYNMLLVVRSSKLVEHRKLVGHMLVGVHMMGVGHMRVEGYRRVEGYMACTLVVGRLKVGSSMLWYTWGRRGSRVDLVLLL